MGRRPKKATDTGKAVLYIRVSSEEQAREGVSLDAQEATLRAYCTMRGLDVVDVAIDAGVSAGKPLADRPAGASLLRAVRTGEAGAVVALKLDRLFRSAADCLDVVAGWDKAGVALHLVDLGGQSVDTSSAMGRFFLTVMAGAAELERNLGGERTSAAKAHKASRGEFNGGRAPYGYRVVRDGNGPARLEEVPDEQAVIAEARKLRAAGLTLKVTAEELDQAGLRSRSGKPWMPMQIARLVS